MMRNVSIEVKLAPTESSQEHDPRRECLLVLYDLDGKRVAELKPASARLLQNTRQYLLIHEQPGKTATDLVTKSGAYALNPRRPGQYTLTISPRAN